MGGPPNALDYTHPNKQVNKPNLGIVVLQRLADGVLEGVDLDKVWEEGQHILDLDHAPCLA